LAHLVPRGVGVTQGEGLDSFAVRSYRYLRLSIVVVVASLLVSLVIERTKVDCWQGSISAYYYTPVQAMFVGALLVIGVSFIVIKGREWEDELLNLAGVFAATVAFVPTSPPPARSKGGCSSIELVARDAEPFIDNNVLAFAIGGALALLLAYAVAPRRRDLRIGELENQARLGLLVGALILLGGLGWYFGDRGSFLDKAHGVAAGLMFVAIAAVILVNALDRRARGKSWWYYAAIVGFMAASVGISLLGKLVDDEWRHQILWLEGLELSAVAVYWLIQTREHWDGGVPTEGNRQLRLSRTPT